MKKIMILILKKNRILFAILPVFAALLLVPFVTYGQSSVTLSVTPTLFEMSVNPGQIWQSSVKVVNTNDFPLTVYAEAVNFAPQGEAGHGKFLPVFENVTEGTTLAEWIELDGSVAVTIQPEQSKSIPFTIQVPEDASPGGHFAAILVGTKPPDSDALVVATSQIVTSLFFVRISGDVVEKGSIRTFSVEDAFVGVPKANFALRFQNDGNVHLQPQGQITIHNMWGKERGVIPINTLTHFGNVLPESMRVFEFSWEGTQSVTDIGRYKASVGLAYGLDSKKYATAETYFWVIPVKPFLITITLLGAFILLIFWIIRSYVRRMLSIAGLDPDETNFAPDDKNRRSRIVYEGDVALHRKTSVVAPVRFGFADLVTRIKKAHAFIDTLKTLGGFVISYKIFFISALLLLVSVMGIVLYFKDVLVADRDYEINIENPDQSTSFNSEEIKLQELTKGAQVNTDDEKQNFELYIVNTSGVSGVAADTAFLLMLEKYTIDSVISESNRIDKNTVIVYDVVAQEEALLLSKILQNASLSASGNTSTTSVPVVTIYAAQDQVVETQ